MFCFKSIVGLCLMLAISLRSESKPQGIVSKNRVMRQYRELFEEFKKIYKKVYETEKEHEHRFNIFVENMKKAEILQSRELGTAQYGVTKFSDLSTAEFKSLYLGLNTKLNAAKKLSEAEIPDIEIPKNFDWRKKNVISEVKDQAICGSCWAFSTTGNIEGLWAIQKKELLSLSEQELVDCDTLDGGCSGGYMTNAYEAIVTLGGLESESDYPYKAEEENCTFKKENVVVKISGGVNITSNEDKMARWLYKNGPISIGINSFNMQLYKSGIAHPNENHCDPYYLNHAVLIVGYGKSKKVPFWIIKNSWGKSWGEEGYYRVYRGDGTCGLNLMASSAVL